MHGACLQAPMQVGAGWHVLFPCPQQVNIHMLPVPNSSLCAPPACRRGVQGGAPDGPRALSADVGHAEGQRLVPVRRPRRSALTGSTGSSSWQQPAGTSLQHIPGDPDFGAALCLLLAESKCRTGLRSGGSHEASAASRPATAA